MAVVKGVNSCSAYRPANRTSRQFVSTYPRFFPLIYISTGAPALKPRDATAAPCIHPHISNPSSDTSPRAVQSPPGLPTTAPRPRQPGFPKYVLRSYSTPRMGSGWARLIRGIQRNEVRMGRYGRWMNKTYEDPGSGMTWSPSAPTHAIQSCAGVMFLRFAMTDKPSTSWRLCPIF